MLDHGLAAAAAPPDLLTPEVRELLLRATHGVPRLISHILRILRISLILADERGQSSIDPAIVNAGGATVQRMPVDVFPDLIAPTVTVLAEAHGMARRSSRSRSRFRSRPRSTAPPGSVPCAPRPRSASP